MTCRPSRTRLGVVSAANGGQVDHKSTDLDAPIVLINGITIASANPVFMTFRVAVHCGCISGCLYRRPAIAAVRSKENSKLPPCPSCQDGILGTSKSKELCLCHSGSLGHRIVTYNLRTLVPFTLH
jgi:hypothetical protein